MGKVLVIGSRGFVGAAVVEALKKNSDLEILTPSRLEFDLEITETHGMASVADLIVCCAESDNSKKISFIESFLAQGKIFVETSADSETIEALSSHFKKELWSQGTLLIGMGIFPGLSNILVKELVKTSAPQRLELTVSTSPFSGAGKDMTRLMVDLLNRPTWKLSSGKRVHALDESKKLVVWFPEAMMLNQTLGFKDIVTYFQPRPAFIAGPL